LTGGIGSGKSTVAERFAALGAAVIDTDQIAHQLTAPDGEAMPRLVAEFGADIATAKGGLDRAAMRARVFSQPTERKKLEVILHPMIRAETQRQLRAVEQPYALLVVPLLMENLASYRPILDRIAVVDCDVERQLARTSARPGLDLAQARAILSTQVSRAKRLENADDVIENQADLASLERQIEQLHRDYLRRAAGLSVAT
jgi:dephospho-CoA kinase